MSQHELVLCTRLHRQAAWCSSISASCACLLQLKPAGSRVCLRACGLALQLPAPRRPRGTLGHSWCCPAASSPAGAQCGCVLTWQARRGRVSGVSECHPVTDATGVCDGLHVAASSQLPGRATGGYEQQFEHCFRALPNVPNFSAGTFDAHGGACCAVLCGSTEQHCAPPDSYTYASLTLLCWPQPIISTEEDACMIWCRGCLGAAGARSPLLALALM